MTHDVSSEPRKWTPAETANIMRYGVCMVCGEPRMQHFERFTNNKQSRVTRTWLACKNGHQGW